MFIRTKIGKALKEIVGKSNFDVECLPMHDDDPICSETIFHLEGVTQAHWKKLTKLMKKYKMEDVSDEEDTGHVALRFVEPDPDDENGEEFEDD